MNDLGLLTNFALFAGAGGLEQGARHTGRIRTVGYCEWDRYAQGVLRSRIKEGALDDAPIWDDIQTLDGRPWRGLVDVLSGGFPCQDVSQAGKREGIKDGTRSGLWSHYARLIGEMEPTYVLAENVRGLLSGSSGRDFGRVLGDLADLGFDAQWYVLSAAAVGAPHRRERVWVVAWHRERERVGRWPTPNVADGRTDKLKSSQQKPGSMHSVTLAQAVQMWPTPTVGDSKSACNKTSGRDPNSQHHDGTTLTDAIRLRWATPTARDGKGSDAPGRQGHPSLCEQVKRAASDTTPRTRHMCGGTGNFEQLKALKEAGSITEAERLAMGGGGQLNPTWVEWLMGWPLEWTVLDSAETEWYRSSRCRRGKSS